MTPRGFTKTTLTSYLAGLIQCVSMNRYEPVVLRDGDDACYAPNVITVLGDGSHHHMIRTDWSTACKMGDEEIYRAEQATTSKAGSSRAKDD
jgi:hypothetical protein